MTAEPAVASVVGGSLVTGDHRHATPRMDRLEVVTPLPVVRRQVAVVGLGYVGLPTVMALVDHGAAVIGLDICEPRLQAIRAGRVDLPDGELTRLSRVVDSPHLALHSDPSVLKSADAVIICVPTPVDDHLAPDLTGLRAACASVVAQARPGQTLILTSTTYVGTTRDLLVRPLEDAGLTVGSDIFVAFSPERIDPGSHGHASTDVPRVLGGVTPRCVEQALEVLAGTAGSLHVVGSPEVAELTKLHENTFRAVNLALVNELADIAGALGLDVREVIDAASTKPYGFMRFMPGPGVGGHCIPCDPHYLLWQLRAMRVSAPLISQAMEGIARRPRRVVERAREVLADKGKSLKGARVLIVGVTYKGGVEDLRESPALEIIRMLLDEGAHVSFADERVTELRLSDGTAVPRLVREEPGGPTIDLALMHTRHPGVDHSWLAEQELVLDATYSLFEVPHRQSV